MKTGTGYAQSSRFPPVIFVLLCMLAAASHAAWAGGHRRRKPVKPDRGAMLLKTLAERLAAKKTQFQTCFVLKVKGTPVGFRRATFRPVEDEGRTKYRYESVEGRRGVHGTKAYFEFRADFTEEFQAAGARLWRKLIVPPTLCVTGMRSAEVHDDSIRLLRKEAGGPVHSTAPMPEKPFIPNIEPLLFLAKPDELDGGSFRVLSVDNGLVTSFAVVMGKPEKKPAPYARHLSVFDTEHVPKATDEKERTREILFLVAAYDEQDKLVSIGYFAPPVDVVVVEEEEMRRTARKLALSLHPER